MDKARHAFGALENIDSAISNGKIDSYDILFVKNAEGKPYVGWIDKDGNKVVVSNDAEFAALENQIATKASAESVETLGSQIASKAESAEVEELGEEVAKKVDAETVQSMIDKATASAIEVVEF